MLNEIGPGVGMGDGDLEHAESNPHNILAVMSVIDPTMASDLADAIIYYLEGKPDEAALVLALSAGGLGGGALAVKLGRAFKAVGKNADEAVKMGKDLADSAKNVNKKSDKFLSADMYKNLTEKMSVGEWREFQKKYINEILPEKEGYVRLYRGQINHELHVYDKIVDEKDFLQQLEKHRYISRNVKGYSDKASRLEKSVATSNYKDLDKLIRKARSQQSYFTDSMEDALNYSEYGHGLKGSLYAINIPTNELSNYLSITSSITTQGMGDNYLIPIDTIKSAILSGDIAGTGSIVIK